MVTRIDQIEEMPRRDRLVAVFTALGIGECYGLEDIPISSYKEIRAMAQIIDPLPPDAQEASLCCYTNATSKIQIARITNIPNWYFERVVFPGQRLVFEAMPQALLEIHSGMMSAILADTIPCDRLHVEVELEGDLQLDELDELDESVEASLISVTAE